MTEKIIYLASASPRRRDILITAGFSPVIIPAHADEKDTPFIPGRTEDYVMSLARLKNDAAVRENPSVSGIIISADTVVSGDDLLPPLGKPSSHREAVDMLSSLSGRSHRVLTGVMLRNTENGKQSVFSCSTEVTFRTLQSDEIELYCSSDEPYDKAGGYGIQGRACVFVSSIHGDYFNVVGLPVCRAAEEFEKIL